MANFKLSAVYTYRREKNLQASANPRQPVRDDADDARSTRASTAWSGTADDGTYGSYQRLSAANRTLITNDPNVAPELQGSGNHADQALSNRWQMLAGYTLSKNRIDNVSVDTSPNFLINANGNITAAANADRPNQFKLTGMYILPWHDVILSGNFSRQQGPPSRARSAAPLAIGAAQTINLEPLGSTRLDTLTTIDVRVGKLFKFANNRSLEASVDFDNLTNADTVCGRSHADAGDAFTRSDDGHARRRCSSSCRRAQILGPRTVVFRAAFKF